MALFAAIKAGDSREVKRLLDGKSSVTEKDESKRTPLHIAASYNRLEIFELLIQRKKLDVNAQDDRGWTPLHYASTTSNLEFCQALLNCKNIKPNLLNQERYTPFLYICKISIDPPSPICITQFYKTLTAFLARGIDLNERTKNGDTALHLAVRAGNLETVDFLCRNNCDVNSINKSKESPLLFACKGTKVSIVRKLLESGAIINTPYHDCFSLEKAAGSPAIREILTQLNTVQLVIEQKRKEFLDYQSRLLEVQAELEILQKQLKRNEKKVVPKPATVKTKKRYRSLVSDLEVCERINQFFMARAGVWVCCMKRIEGLPLQALYQSTTFLTELDHPNLLPVLKVSKTDQNVQLFVQMTSLTLADYLRQKRNQLGQSGKMYLTPKEITRFALDIALGIEYLHENRVVNRNIKSNAIYIILKDQQIEHTLVNCFYAAKTTEPILPVLEKNMDFFDPFYATASEVRLQPNKFCNHSDVWSFGMVLFELLTLSIPYTQSHGSKTEEQLIEYMKSHRPNLPEEFQPLCNYYQDPSSRSSGQHSIPMFSSPRTNYSAYQNLVHLLEACTELDPLQRPTISEIVNALRNGVSIKEVNGLKLQIKSKSDGVKGPTPLVDWVSSNQTSFYILPRSTYSNLIVSVANYHIESPLDANSLVRNPVFIQRYEQNQCYYLENLAFVPHENYHATGEDSENFAVISLELEGSLTEDNLYCYKMIFRDLTKDQRILVTAENSKDRLRAFKSHPLLSNYPKLQLIKDPSVIQSLIEFERSQLEPKTYKFGIIYRKRGQMTENEMLSNQSHSKHFTQFLNFLGQRVQLKDWKHFRGGLDVVTNTTGTETIYTKWLNDFEIIFHVSTLLPYDPDDPQQLQRKRHIGNDVVVIIFQDEDADKFSPEQWASSYNHVFVVIQAVESSVLPTPRIRDMKYDDQIICHPEEMLVSDPELSYASKYQIGVTCKDVVSMHSRPFLQHPCVHERNEEFREFLLTKLINCERMAMQSANFEKRFLNMRKQLLLPLCTMDSKGSKKRRNRGNTFFS